MLGGMLGVKKIAFDNVMCCLQFKVIMFLQINSPYCDIAEAYLNFEAMSF